MGQSIIVMLDIKAMFWVKNGRFSAKNYKSKASDFNFCYFHLNFFLLAVSKIFSKYDGVQKTIQVGTRTKKWIVAPFYNSCYSPVSRMLRVCAWLPSKQCLGQKCRQKQAQTTIALCSRRWATPRLPIRIRRPSDTTVVIWTLHDFNIDGCLKGEVWHHETICVITIL